MRPPYLRLVVTPANTQNAPVNSIGARAHWAYHCMPRDTRDRLPTVRAVEKSVGLTNARLQKVLSGETEKPSVDTLMALARALSVPFEWLAFGRGEAPSTVRHIPVWDPSAYRSGEKRPARKKVSRLPNRSSGTTG